MSERLIFIESNTTGTGMLALDIASRLGLDPLLLTSAPQRYRGLDAAQAEVLECDTNDLPALTTVVQRRRSEIVGVTTTSEFYLPAVAELAEQLGLPGNPPNAIRLCRNKASARVALADLGLGQPRFVAIRDFRRLAPTLRAVGLPCVVKPVDESGSQNVRLCRSEPQVRAQLKRVLAARVNARDQPAAGLALVEEYLDGPEYSVEMFSTGGVARCVGITAKCVAGPPFFVETGHYYPAGIGPAATDRMVSTVRSALQAVGIRQGPTHTEVKLLADRVAVIEINARLAGGMIPELVRRVSGIDLIEQQLRAAAGLPVQLEPSAGTDRCVGIRFVLAERAGVVTRVDGVEAAAAVAGVNDVLVRARPGERVAPARDAYQRIGHVMAAGPDQPAVRAGLDEAMRLIQITVDAGA